MSASHKYILRTIVNHCLLEACRNAIKVIDVVDIKQAILAAAETAALEPSHEHIEAVRMLIHTASHALTAGSAERLTTHNACYVCAAVDAAVRFYEDLHSEASEENAPAI